MFDAYHTTFIIFGIAAAMFLIQLIVADVVALRQGHTPGHPVEADHASLIFRASRAIANSNESVAIFVLAVLFSIFLGGSASWTNLGATVYVAGRAGHMLFYYANASLLRSVSFAVSLVGIVIILAAGFKAL